MSQLTFFNTTNESGETLRNYREAARSQDTKIAEYFADMNMPMSPSQVNAAVLKDSPLTSIRRSITNLTQRGVLRKTETKVDGPYGRPEYLWELNV
ncbi:MAG: hypothetical protein CMB80_34810 [Flammeovirgaceae bacterium]|nr:hypothetical protein [Flammeovirgaceae bacterium]